MKTGGSKTVRCAIYARVSTDQGLEQDFNSLDAQYDASQAYIRSQQHAGWTMAGWPRWGCGGGGERCRTNAMEDPDVKTHRYSAGHSVLGFATQ
jgi:hypothetical protein